MKKLKTFVEHGKNGDRLVADLYETESGFTVMLHFEVNEVHVATVTCADNNLKVWHEVIS